jgi:hypothetical protein
MDELRQSGKFIRGLSSVQKAVANWNVTIQGSVGFSKIPEVTSRSSDMPTHRNLSECGDIEGAASPANVENPTRRPEVQDPKRLPYDARYDVDGPGRTAEIDNPTRRLGQPPIDILAEESDTPTDRLPSEEIDQLKMRFGHRGAIKAVGQASLRLVSLWDLALGP